MKILIKIGFISLAMITISTNIATAKSKWWDKLFSNKDESIKELTTTEIGKAFKQALSIGAQNVVSQLGEFDGFNSDQNIRIDLPKNLLKIKKTLDKFGLAGIVDDLEVKINRAAEKATPVAKELFIQSIKDMTFEDVRKIYKGNENSATLYFQEKMSPILLEKLNPIISNSLSDVGAIQSFNSIIKKYEKIPFVSQYTIDLNSYVSNKTAEGIFYYLAKQEAEIRKNPLKHSTDLLKKVFGKN